MFGVDDIRRLLAGGGNMLGSTFDGFGDPSGQQQMLAGAPGAQSAPRPTGVPAPQLAMRPSGMPDGSMPPIPRMPGGPPPMFGPGPAIGSPRRGQEEGMPGQDGHIVPPPGLPGQYSMPAKAPDAQGEMYGPPVPKDLGNPPVRQSEPPTSPFGPDGGAEFGRAIQANQQRRQAPQPQAGNPAAANAAVQQHQTNLGKMGSAALNQSPFTVPPASQPAVWGAGAGAGPQANQRRRQ